MSEFSKVLRKLRLDLKYSQQQLAAMLGVAKSTISMYENGNREPDLAALKKIADLFEVDMDYLTGRTGFRSAVQTDGIRNQEPTYGSMEQLIARNGNQLTSEEKMKLIKMLAEL